MFKSISITSPIEKATRRLSSTGSDGGGTPTASMDRDIYIAYIDGHLHASFCLLASLGLASLDWTCYVCGTTNKLDLRDSSSPAPVDDEFFRRQQTKTMIRMGMASKKDLLSIKAETPSPSSCTSRFCAGPASVLDEPILRPLTRAEQIRASIGATPISLSMGAIHAILYGPYTSLKVAGARSSDYKLTCPVYKCSGLVNVSTTLVKSSLTVEEASMILVSVCTSNHIKLDDPSLYRKAHDEAMNMTRSMEARGKCNHHT